MNYIPTVTVYTAVLSACLASTYQNLFIFSHLEADHDVSTIEQIMTVIDTSNILKIFCVYKYEFIDISSGTDVLIKNVKFTNANIFRH